MPLNPIVAGAVVTAGTMALPFAVSSVAVGFGFSPATVLASTVATRVMIACGGVVAKGSACVVVKAIGGVGLAKKALVATVVGVASVVVIAQIASKDNDGDWPLAVYVPVQTFGNDGGNDGEDVDETDTKEISVLHQQ
ncbi:hypothetical protein BGZ47_006002 [Haplosporangium gracile]|nr:hypothetical protein BGZ47_006002 [Haplosporangium gracile]